MAECVSCGRDIPAGSFFCEDCYVKMKGRRGPSGEVPRGEGIVRKEEAARGDAAPDATAAEARGAVPAGIPPVRKASGTLTPSSGKKVVSLKPQLERGGREKGGKKRFTVTITFSERTYAALARMKRRKAEGAAGEGGVAGGHAPGRRSLARKYGKGPHGRPKLKAVTATHGSVKARRRGLGGAMAYRDRPMDGGDTVSAVMATVAALAIIALTFRPWARVSLGVGEPSAVQEIEVTGADLGAVPYICIALAAAALLYMLAARVFGGVFAVVDYGVAFIAIGVVVIPLFYAAIASNAGMLSAAMEKLGAGGGPTPEQFERQTLWPAYMVVLAGAMLAFAGLVRLSERRREAMPAGETSRGDG